MLKKTHTNAKNQKAELEVIICLEKAGG